MIVYRPTTGCSAGLQSHTQHPHASHTLSALMKEMIWIQSPEWLSFSRIRDRRIRQRATDNHLCWILHFSVIFLWLCRQRYFVWQPRSRVFSQKDSIYSVFHVISSLSMETSARSARASVGTLSIKSKKYVHFSTYFHAFIILFL